MRCDIIIPVWNQPGITRECVESIVKNTSYPYRLILVDNGSDGPTRSYLEGIRSLPGVDAAVLRNDENLGFVRAVNQGIRASDAPYLCIMNNDTLATKGWLAEMVGVMGSDPRIGIVNPSSNTSAQSPPKGATIDDYALSLEPLKGQTQELSVCRGFCMLLKRAVVESTGYFDEVYDPGYFEEADYSKRARAQGYSILRSKAAYVFHRESATFAALKARGEIFRRNEGIFFSRWGRPVRVAYVTGASSSPDRLRDIAVNTARLGHQIFVFVGGSASWPAGLDHFDIRKFELPRFLYRTASLFKILRRKKKKKMDLIVADDEGLGRVLRWLKGLHRSEVLVRPDDAGLKRMLTKISREYRVS